MSQGGCDSWLDEAQCGVRCPAQADLQNKQEREK